MWGRTFAKDEAVPINEQGKPVPDTVMLDTVAERLTRDHAADRFYAREWSRRPGGLGFGVRPARAQFTDERDDLQRTLFGLLGAIGFVLLIVCANVANLTLVLLTGAGLMIESVVRLLRVDPGFDPENLVRINFQLPWDQYNDQEHGEAPDAFRILRTEQTGLLERQFRFLDHPAALRRTFRMRRAPGIETGNGTAQLRERVACALVTQKRRIPGKTPRLAGKFLRQIAHLGDGRFILHFKSNQVPGQSHPVVAIIQHTSHA